MCFFTLLPNPTFQTGNDPLLLFRFFSISMIYTHIWKLERTYEVFWIFVCFFIFVTLFNMIFSISINIPAEIISSLFFTVVVAFHSVCL